MAYNNVIPAWVVMYNSYKKQCKQEGIVPMTLEEYKDSDYPLNPAEKEIT
jgi:hypothetical protein